MEGHKDIERRRFIRIPFWFVTKYRVYPYRKNSAGIYKYGIGKNISSGGICFETEDDFSVDTVLEVELDMPALDHGVCILGQIVWMRAQKEKGKYICGLAFSKIRAEDIEAVEKIVKTFS